MVGKAQFVLAVRWGFGFSLMGVQFNCCLRHIPVAFALPLDFGSWYLLLTELSFDVLLFLLIIARVFVPTFLFASTERGRSRMPIGDGEA
jgi:hypothetical protein